MLSSSKRSLRSHGGATTTSLSGGRTPCLSLNAAARGLPRPPRRATPLQGHAEVHPERLFLPLALLFSLTSYLCRARCIRHNLKKFAGVAGASRAGSLAGIGTLANRFSAALGPQEPDDEEDRDGGGTGTMSPVTFVSAFFERLRLVLVYLLSMALSYFSSSDGEDNGLDEELAVHQGPKSTSVASTSLLDVRMTIYAHICEFGVLWSAFALQLCKHLLCHSGMTCIL